MDVNISLSTTEYTGFLIVVHQHLNYDDTLNRFSNGLFSLIVLKDCRKKALSIAVEPVALNSIRGWLTIVA